MSRVALSLTGLIVSGLLLLPSLHAGEANIFIYHRFSEPKYSSTNIAADVFAAQLELLASGNYQVLALTDVVCRLTGGESLPEKTVVLTVDDAFGSFLDAGLPLIERYGFPVTLFVNTGSVGQSGYLNWQQIRSLRSRGVEIGSHGSAHLHMTDRLPGETDVAWSHRMQADLNSANADFKRELGEVPALFAYPYGEYSNKLMALVENSGYQAAVAQQSGVVSQFADLYELPRFPMGGAYATLSGFASKLNMRALPIKELGPHEIVLEEDNPPSLEVQIVDLQLIDPARLNCFVAGEMDCQVEVVDRERGVYRVVANKRLTGRRTKYTLTAPGRLGGWFWYSRLWINGAVEEGY